MLPFLVGTAVGFILGKFLTSVRVHAIWAWIKSLKKK